MYAAKRSNIKTNNLLNEQQENIPRASLIGKQKQMSRLFKGVNAQKVKALASQEDEEELILVENCPPKYSNKDELGDKNHLVRSLVVLKCLSPFAVLREVRNGGYPKEESASIHRLSSKRRYYLVDEDDRSAASEEGSDRDILFQEKTLAKTQGEEWDDSDDSNDENDKIFSNCCSPVSRTTVRTALTSASETPKSLKIFEEKCFEFDQHEQQKPQNAAGKNQDQAERNSLQMEIIPISVQFPLDIAHGFSEGPKDNCSDIELTNDVWKAKSTKPDPPATMFSDSNLLSERSSDAQDENSSRPIPTSVTKGNDSDRTVVSELTCESLNEGSSALRDKTCMTHSGTVTNGVKTGILQKYYENNKDERSTSSQESPTKMQDLINKFESLSNSKTSLERCSAILKPQQKDGEGVNLYISRSSMSADLANGWKTKGSREDAERGSDGGFFWRSKPRPSEQTHSNNSDPKSDGLHISEACRARNQEVSYHRTRTKLVDV